MSEPGTRRQVALAGHRGDVQTARTALESPDPAVRATALGALARSASLTAADVRTGLEDAAPVVRARAAELAAVFGGEGAPWLVSLLDDRQAEVVEAACFALGEIGDEAAGHRAAMDGLARVATAHADPLCREAAVAALGAVGHPAGLATVLAAMADKPAVRRRAVLALAAFDGPDVDLALEAALGDRDWQVRQAAEDLTGRRSGR